MKYLEIRLDSKSRYAVSWMFKVGFSKQDGKKTTSMFCDLFILGPPFFSFSSFPSFPSLFFLLVCLLPFTSSFPLFPLSSFSRLKANSLPIVDTSPLIPSAFENSLGPVYHNLSPCNRAKTTSQPKGSSRFQIRSSACVTGFLGVGWK